MASCREPAGAEGRLRSSAPRDKKKHPPSEYEKESRPIRRSARIRNTSQPRCSGNDRGQVDSASATAGETTKDGARSQTPNKPTDFPLKRKRTPEVQRPPLQRDPPSSKRPRTSAQSSAAESPKKAESDARAHTVDPLKSWVLEQKWPKEYFEQGSEPGEDPFDHDSWLEEQMEQTPPPIVKYVEINGFRYPQPIRKTPASLRRKQSDSSLTGSSDHKKRESKSTQYRDTRYTTLLAAKGSFLHDFGDDNPPRTITDPGQQLLNGEQAVPQNTLFRDDLFWKICRKTDNRNEAMIIQDISRLLVPSAQNLAIYGDSHLNVLIESVNEAWTGCIPVEGPRPQPDYSVGFTRSAFTEEQLNKLDPIIGSVFDTSFFVATYRMYLPFFTCEVKCGAVALDVADRQNAHSMTIAVRGVVELYRAVNREQELNQKILAFSVSHDHRIVRIYGHYPVIDGRKTTCYRHLIEEFSFKSGGGTDKWTAYKFTKNVYDVWMPEHLKRICSAIDQLPPKLNFQVFEGSEPQPSEVSVLSEELDGLLSHSSNVDSASQIIQGDSEPTPIIAQTNTPDTSISKDEGQVVPKKAKRNRTKK